MALSSTFRDRLEHMERSRNQCLSLLQAEKDLQAEKSNVLSTKLASVRSIEQKCLVLESNIASRKFKISALKSEFETLEAKYESGSQELRVLQSEMDELTELKKEKDRFYEMNEVQMKQFRDKTEKFTVDYRIGVERLKKRVNESKSSFQGNNGHLSNAEIAAAELRKAELLTVKQNVERSLASNYYMRAQLQNQLQRSKAHKGSTNNIA